MCIPALAAGLAGLGGAGAATAAGATAAASTLSTIGTVVGIGGSLLSGLQGYQASKAQADALTTQAEQEAALGAVQDERERKQFMSSIAKQRAELAARGVTLDSVTAVSLGQTAAAEMSFGSQATRSGTAARTAELSSAAKATKFGGLSSMLRGTFNAADTFLTAAPDIWPSLKGA